MLYFNYFTTHYILQVAIFSPKLNEFLILHKFADDEDDINMANGWLEEQDEQFFYSGIRALEKTRQMHLLFITFQLSQPLMVAGVCYVKVQATSRSLGTLAFYLLLP